jgi:hypothetical protein
VIPPLMGCKWGCERFFDLSRLFSLTRARVRVRAKEVRPDAEASGGTTWRNVRSVRASRKKRSTSKRRSAAKRLTATKRRTSAERRSPPKRRPTAGTTSAAKRRPPQKRAAAPLPQQETIREGMQGGSRRRRTPSPPTRNSKGREGYLKNRPQTLRTLFESGVFVAKALEFSFQFLVGHGASYFACP